MPKLTVLTNVYNEEYLLPFWLEHHKRIFDHGIVVDYRSTDSSMEIVRRICPTWEIRTTKNSHFDARDIDTEFMEIESTIPGFKIVLNTTEFLVSAQDVRTFLPEASEQAYALQCLTAISSQVGTYPADVRELLSQIERVEPTRRRTRTLHSHVHGNYPMGRHDCAHPITRQLPVYVMWFGFHPWNEKLLQRKLQIKHNIPERDKRSGAGFHHFWGMQEQDEQRALYTRESVPLETIPTLEIALKSICQQ
jgi:hypothetical protein